MEVMMEPDMAMMAGLRMPAKADCAVCHYAKGSHVAVHSLPPLDLDKAWQQINHVTPMNGAPRHRDKQPASPESGARYVSSAACAACHEGPMMGLQYSLWRMSAHSRAYATLGTPKAFEIALEKGLKSEPQASVSCLACHAAGQGPRTAGQISSFFASEGVGCEECHGPGSEYMTEAVMRDRTAAHDQGLRPVTSATCGRCHGENPHGKPFDFGQARRAIAHPRQAPKVTQTLVYKTPVNLAVSPDGGLLYVACESSNSVFVDKATRTKIEEIPVGGQPADVTFRPDGKAAYVSNRLDDTLSVIDVSSRRVLTVLPVGDEPHGVLTDTQGKRLVPMTQLTQGWTITNGLAPTLEEIWTVYNPYHQHGVTNDMTKDQLNDLIEYLKTL